MAVPKKKNKKVKYKYFVKKKQYRKKISNSIFFCIFCDKLNIPEDININNLNKKICLKCIKKVINKKRKIKKNYEKQT